MRNFLQCIKDMVLGGPISPEQASEALGCDEHGKPMKSHWTLYKELNPDDPTAKLGAVTLLQLMVIYQDAKPLEMMASRLGKCVVDIPDPKAGNVFCEATAYAMVAEVELAASELLKEVHKALKNDGKIDKHELSIIFERVHDAHTKLAAISSGASKVSGR